VTRYRNLASALLVLTAIAFSNMAVALADPRREGPTASTSDGPVRGILKDGVNQFLGIPYAAPPVGDLRWRPPQPPKKHGLLDATQFASPCPQVTSLGVFAGPASINEDCLYLNIFTTGGKNKPVLVWVHGGGHFDGTGNDYDGTKLATSPSSPTVVVTINYRVGLFGFLSESHLNAEGHLWGNYGLLDNFAALKWVKANIAAFGGDPNNVTLAGQSAGAWNTTAAVVSPLARGLFQRAIMQSYPVSNLFTAAASNPGLSSAATALQRGNDFAAAANCSTAACLRKLSPARILQLQGTPNSTGSYRITPVVDGTIIPAQPAVAWASGQYNKMPIMGGATKDDNSTFNESTREYFSSPQAPLTADQYTSLVNGTYVPPLYLSGTAAKVLAQYPPGANPQVAYGRSFTDPGNCRALHSLKLLAASNGRYGVYGYDFTYRNAPWYFPKMPNPQEPTGNFMARAAHTIDIQFLFDNWHGGQLGVNLDQTTGQPRELQGSELTLSRQLVAAWTNFAKTGNPNGTGAPVWPAFKATTGSFLNEDIQNSTETEAQYRTAYQCDFWDPLMLYPTN
jgi:para-nitrobenzyl esterase